MKFFIILLIFIFDTLPTSAAFKFPNPTKEQLEKLPPFVQQAYQECFKPLTEQEQKIMEQYNNQSLPIEEWGDVWFYQRMLDDIAEAKSEEDSCLFRKVYPKAWKSSKAYASPSVWPAEIKQSLKIKNHLFKNPVFYPTYERLTPFGFYSEGEDNFLKADLVDDDYDFILMRREEFINIFHIPVYYFYYDLSNYMELYSRQKAAYFFLISFFLDEKASSLSQFSNLRQVGTPENKIFRKFEDYLKERKFPVE